MEGLPDIGAVGWVHYRLGGGWKVLIALGLGYMVLVGGTAGLTLRINPPEWQNVLKIWTYACLALQALNLLLAGPFRVWLAVMHDGSTGMLESHRLMPLAPWRAIFGYLTGGVAQVWTLALASLAMQLLLGTAAGLEPEAIVIANTLLLSIGVMFWTVMVLWAMIARWVSLIVGAIFAMVMLGGGFMLVAIVPGAWMFGGTLLGSLDLTQTGDSLMNLGRAVALLIEMAFTTVFFIAAARKYRHSHEPAFGPSLGLPLVALWVAASAVGMIWYQRLLPWRALSAETMEMRLLIVAGLVSTMLVALGPVISAARWAETQAALRSKGQRGRTSPGGMVVVVVVLMLGQIAMPLAVSDWHTAMTADMPDVGLNWLWAAVVSGVVMVSFVTMVYWGMRLILRSGMKGWTLALGILGMIGLWLLPLFAEALLAIMTSRGHWYPAGLLAGISPAGTLALVWDPHSDWTVVIAGTVLQALAGAVVSGIGILWLREGRVRTPARQLDLSGGARARPADRGELPPIGR